MTEVEKELHLDFEAVERTERVILGSTVLGSGAISVAYALEVLTSMKKQMIASMKQSLKEDENEVSIEEKTI